MILRKKDVEFVLSEETRRKISKTLKQRCSGSKTKLDWNKVREIRRRFEMEEISKSELARQCNVDRSQICRIIANQTWKEIDS